MSSQIDALHPWAKEEGLENPIDEGEEDPIKVRFSRVIARGAHRRCVRIFVRRRVRGG